MHFSTSYDTDAQSLQSNASQPAAFAVARRMTDEGASAGEMRMVRMFALLSLVVSIAVPITVWAIVGCMYKSGVTDKRDPFSAGSQNLIASLEPNELCLCFQNISLCLHACCCTSVRAADTFQTAGVATFWCVMCVELIHFFTFQVLTFVFNMVMVETLGADQSQNPGSSPAWFISALIFAGYWANLRTAYRSKFNGQGKCVSDFFCYCCCFPCSIGQDAFVLDAAQNVRVECCCSLIKQGAVGGVGQPAVVGQVVQGTIVK